MRCKSLIPFTGDLQDYSIFVLTLTLLIMGQLVMNGELVMEGFQPFHVTPPDLLPPAWRPGSTDPQFSGGLALDQLGLASPLHGATGRIVTYHPGTGMGFGTGFVVHPRVVMTAAHVVHGIKGPIVFQPGFNGKPMAGYEKVAVQDVFVPIEYQNAPNAWYDYAILLLQAPLPPTFPRLAPLSLPHAIDLLSPAEIAGYNGNLLKVSSGSLIKILPKALNYTAATSSGYSGGAVVPYPNPQHRFVGIHKEQDWAAPVTPGMEQRINHIINNLSTRTF